MYYTYPVSYVRGVVQHLLELFEINCTGGCPFSEFGNFNYVIVKFEGLSKCELSTPGDEAQFAGGRITQVAKENYEKWATENQSEIARQVCALPIQIPCLPTSATTMLIVVDCVSAQRL